MEIIALKIKTIYSDSVFFHGSDHIFPANFSITEEDNTSTNSDSKRMKEAGARRVFIIRSRIEFLLQAFNKFLEVVDYNHYIICESNSLAEIIKPALFFLILKENSNEMKTSALRLIKFVDKIIYTNGEIHNFNPEHIFIKNNCWQIENISH